MNGRLSKKSICSILFFILFLLQGCSRFSHFSLQVMVEGPGEVLIDPIRGSFPKGAQVTLRAKPEDSSSFLQWGGDILGYDQEITLVINSHTVVMAFFVFTDPITIRGAVAPIHTFHQEAERSLGALPLADSMRYSQQKILHSTRDRERPIEEIIVGLSPSLDGDEGRIFLSQLGFEVLDSLHTISSYLVRPLEGMEISQGILLLKQSPEVFYVEANHPLSLQGEILPQDPLYPLQWNLPLIHLPAAWEVSRGSPSIRVAVLDTGVYVDHPDLVGVLDLENAYNFANDTTDVHDDHGHGTHVTGIIAATANNYEGIAGVMWEGSILPLKVFDRGLASSWNVAQAILYASGLDPYLEQEAVDIINLSLGSAVDSEALRQAVEKAHQAGILLVAASGNSNSSVLYPAAYPQTIAVGAVDYNYPYTPKRAHYSCYGEGLDLMAPGGSMRVDSDRDGYVDGIWSSLPLTVNPKGYGLMAGTSMAAPHVAGLIGLMLGAGISPYQVRSILERTAMNIGPKDEYGWGLIHASWAIHDVAMQVIVGERIGDRVSAVKEVVVPPRGGDFVLKDIPPGEHYLIAWVDVKKNGVIDRGDYYGEIGPLLFEPGEDYYEELSLYPVVIEGE